MLKCSPDGSFPQIFFNFSKNIKNVTNGECIKYKKDLFQKFIFNPSRVSMLPIPLWNFASDGREN